MKETMGFKPEANTGKKKENPKEKESEIRKKVEGIRDFMKEVSKESKKEGFPIGNNGRIDMRAFEKVYSKGELKKDNDYIKQKENLFNQEALDEGLSKDEIEEKKLMSNGERFEKLKTAVMHKAFKEKFIVARSSRYDDIKNGIDNVIIEKETGNIVCAVDDVATDENSKQFEEKKRKVIEKNMAGGAKLKYGITIDKRGWMHKTELHNIPVFHLALKDIEEAERELDLSTKESSDGEKKLALGFLSSIREQIEFFIEFSKGKSHLNVFRKNLIQNKETLEKLERM